MRSTPKPPNLDPAIAKAILARGDIDHPAIERAD